MTDSPEDEVYSPVYKALTVVVALAAAAVVSLMYVLTTGVV